MKFEQCRGGRIYSRFIELRPNNNMWWCYSQKRWITWEETYDLEDCNDFGHPPALEFQRRLYKTNYKLRSFKSMRRFIKKHGIKGVEYRLVSRFRGYDIYITKKEKI